MNLDTIFPARDLSLGLRCYGEFPVDLNLTRRMALKGSLSWPIAFLGCNQNFTSLLEGRPTSVHQYPFFYTCCRRGISQAASPPVFDRPSIKLFSEGSRSVEEMSLWHTSTVTERAGNQFRRTGNPRTILRLIIWDFHFGVLESITFPISLIAMINNKTNAIVLFRGK